MKGYRFPRRIKKCRMAFTILKRESMAFDLKAGRLIPWCVIKRKERERLEARQAARATHIGALLERMLAASNPAEAQALSEELSEFIFGVSFPIEQGE